MWARAVDIFFCNRRCRWSGGRQDTGADDEDDAASDPHWRREDAERDDHRTEQQCQWNAEHGRQVPHDPSTVLSQRSDTLRLPSSRRQERDRTRVKIADCTIMRGSNRAITRSTRDLCMEPNKTSNASAQNMKALRDTYRTYRSGNRRWNALARIVATSARAGDVASFAASCSPCRRSCSLTTAGVHGVLSGVRSLRITPYRSKRPIHLTFPSRSKACSTKRTQADCVPLWCLRIE
jgi:hypothetical protein